jgi:eukaryotic-like serine/threonine-protein kinase
MGEVYRAHDPRLGREVAIKVLPAEPSRPGDHLRLEREARAAGNLNHPNLLSVFDIGFHGTTPYVVAELLDGETLRERLKAGPLPFRKAVDLGVQAARGLAAAHEKGICHRDIKPENLFVTRDGRLKILDFGLAKATGPKHEGTGPLEVDLTTESGIVVGTVGYMAPEQAHGLSADHRSDIFALGAVLYEMMSGRRAFHQESAVETLHAIIKTDPPSLVEGQPQVPGAAWRVVRHCLEKDPHERFQSAQDLAFQLQELLEGATGSGFLRLEEGRRRWSRAWPWALAAGLLLLAAWATARAWPTAPTSHFQQLTFLRGTVHAARFAPDGNSVVYGAAWDGRPAETWLTLPGRPESRSLNLPGGSVFAVSRGGEMAVCLRHRYLGGERFGGTLAVGSLGGGAPREVMEDVEGADWGPDGSSLAVVRAAGRNSPSRLEYPMDTVLYESTGCMQQPRVSPGGDAVAFLDDPAGVGFGGTVTVVDRTGTRKALTPRYANARGLAWSPSGDEVWFTAGDETADRALRAVDLSGRQRVLAEVPGSLTLRDVARDGRVLLSVDEERGGILGLPPGETVERELSWLDRSGLADLSADGRTLLFGDQFHVYTRGTDGSEAVRLGEGHADALSPDGRWVLSTSTDSRRLVLLPDKAGHPRPLASRGIESYAGAWWLGPDRVVFNGRGRGTNLRCYVQDVGTDTPQARTAEGTYAVGVQPDGRVIAVSTDGQPLQLIPVDGGGPPVPLAGSETGDRPVGWGADGRFVWVFRRGEIPARIMRLDRATGRRELWKSLRPADPAGVLSVTKAAVTPDGRAYAYSYRRVLSDLYLVEGLR